MSTLIAIETSTELASVALLHDDEIIMRESSGVQTHSQSVLPLLQQLLAEAGLALARCDAIGFGCGPGSFTGVRTACGLAQGLAFGADLPVVPVVSLEAMAEAALLQHGAESVLAVLDARMGEVYWAEYEFDGGNQAWQVLSAPKLAAAAAIQLHASDARHSRAAGNGLVAYAEQLPEQVKGLASDALCMPHASAVARLAARAHNMGHALAPHLAQPLYLRNKVALTTAEREARAAA